MGTQEPMTVDLSATALPAVDGVHVTIPSPSER